MVGAQLGEIGGEVHEVCRGRASQVG
jgi:hypothetical protein